MTIITFALGALAAAQPQASVEQPVQPPFLWGPLRAGMTKAEVKAIQPLKTVKLNETCSGLLSFSYRKGRLNEVEMTSASTTLGECLTLMEKSLEAKYGDHPKRETKYTRGYCGYSGTVASLCRAMGGDKLVKHTFSQWAKDGVIVTLELTDVDNDWTITYSPDPVASASVIDKF